MRQRKKNASDDISQVDLLTWNLQVESLLKVPKMSTRTIPRLHWKMSLSSMAWIPQVLNHQEHWGEFSSFWMIDAALLSQSLLEFVMSGHDWPVVMSNPSCMSNYLKLMCRARVPKIPCQSVLSNLVPNIQDPKIPQLMKCFSHFQGWGFRIFGSMDSSW